MLAMKRIQGTDTSVGVVNKAWVSGQFYDMYRHDYDGTVAGVDLLSGNATYPADLHSSNFYVITDEYNIYKCIWNNSGVASTVKPTGQSTAQFTTADGYVWKFVGLVPPSAATKFQTNNFAPVKKVGANPGSSDPYYPQYLVEQAAVSGAIGFIKVNAGGAGYTIGSSSVPVTITGDGAGATATATTNSSGRVTSITVTAQGTGYTWASITVGGGGSGATATAIISPRNGHGYDITRELGAAYLIIDTTLAQAEGSGDFPVNISYRRLGIIKDPCLYGTSTVATGTTYTTNGALNLSAATGTFLANEIITGGTSGATAVVVSWDATNKIIRYYQTSSQSGTFTGTENIVGGTSAATGTISSKTNPEIDIFSGEMIYVEHRRPVARDITQTEDVKIFLEA